MKNYTTIIWDFNGTLVDDVYAALGAVNDMLIRRDQQTITIDDYYKAVDTPIWHFYEQVFIPGTITPEEAIAEFDSGYDKHLNPNPLMDGAAQMLSYLASLNKTQLVVSASHIHKVTSKLESLGIIGYFHNVLALTDYHAGDKTFLAQQYLSDNQINPNDVIVIGDCVADWQMAQALGCDCILNTKGHQSVREFAVTNAVIIDSLYELKNIIK
ncbi:MAG: HAD family hydrolase [Ruminococcus sp.]|nr:HAD family hydrolase [Ruminococcus sp.]